MEIKTSKYADLNLFFFIATVYSCERVFGDKWIEVAADSIREFFGKE